jgi:hypothetical protein
MAKIIQCPICAGAISYVDQWGTVFCESERKYPMYCKKCDKFWYANKNPKEHHLKCPGCGIDVEYLPGPGASEGITGFCRDMVGWKGTAGTSL